MLQKPEAFCASRHKPTGKKGIEGEAVFVYCEPLITPVVAKQRSRDQRGVQRLRLLQR
jgi:hypothetical protein